MAALFQTKELGTTTSSLTQEQLERTGKLKIVLISRQMLVGLLQQGNGGRFIRVEGMPDDAVIVGISNHYAFNQDQITLKVWSDTFPTVPEGHTIEVMELWCSEYREGEKRGREFI